MLTLWVDFVHHKVVGIRLYDKWVKPVPFVYQGPMVERSIGLHSNANKVRIIEAAEKQDEEYLLSLV